MRRPYILIILAVILLVAGWSGYWLWVKGRLETEIVRFIEMERSKGIEIGDGGREIGGFPLRLEIQITAPRVAKGQLWTWSAPELTAYIQPWNLNHVILKGAAEQTVEWTEGGVRRRAKIFSERALASGMFAANGAIEQAAAEFIRPRIEEAGLGSISAERAQIHFRANHGETPERPTGSIGLALSAEQIRLPDTVKAPLGSDMPLLSAVMTLPPPLPPAERSSLPAWRDEGGVVNFDYFALAWGPLDANGNGSVTLDKAMRPLASLGTEIRGFGPTVDAYAEAGLIKPKAAVALKIALGGLAKADDRGRPTVKMPITIQDGRLFIGPIGVADIQPVFAAD